MYGNEVGHNPSLATLTRRISSIHLKILGQLVTWEGINTVLEFYLTEVFIQSICILFGLFYYNQDVRFHVIAAGVSIGFKIQHLLDQT